MIQLVRRPGKKTPLGRPRHRWEDNIKMDHKEVGYEGVDWTLLAQGDLQWWAVVNIVMNLQVPLKVGNFLTYQAATSFSRRTLF
jgi:hypothetical protein